MRRSIGLSLPTNASNAWFSSHTHSFSSSPLPFVPPRTFMQIPHGRTFTAIALALHAAPVHRGCHAFGGVGVPPVIIRTANGASARSNAMRSGDDPIVRRVVSGTGEDIAVGSSPLSSSQAAATARQGGSSSSTPDLVEYELERALEYARDVDKKYGLCTEQSQSAWKVVDEAYERIHSMAATSPRPVRGG